MPVPLYIKFVFHTIIFVSKNIRNVMFLVCLFVSFSRDLTLVLGAISPAATTKLTKPVLDFVERDPFETLR